MSLAEVLTLGPMLLLMGIIDLLVRRAIRGAREARDTGGTSDTGDAAGLDGSAPPSNQITLSN